MVCRQGVGKKSTFLANNIPYMNRLFLRASSTILAFAVPSTVLADNPSQGPYNAPGGLLSSGQTFGSIVLNLVSLINLTIGVLAAFAVVVFFWGLVRFIRESSDSHAHGEGKERIIWSLVALFVLFSVWGILALMSVAFFGGSTSTGTYNPSTSAGAIY